MAQEPSSPSRPGGESSTDAKLDSSIQSAAGKTSSPSRQAVDAQTSSLPLEMVEMKSLSNQPDTPFQPQEPLQPSTISTTPGYQIDTQIPSSSFTPIVATAPTFQGSSSHNAGSTAEEPAIAPASDIPNTHNAIHINLLNPVTDTRHPYTIDESYLKRRDVKVVDGNPINMTVYTLKELIWRDWRHDWEAKPSTPTLIRLIYMGRLLDDKQTLKDSRFSNSNNAHVVHMTIKPQDVAEEEDGKVAKSHRSTHGEDDPSPRCRCVIL